MCCHEFHKYDQQQNRGASDSLVKLPLHCLSPLTHHTHTLTPGSPAETSTTKVLSMILIVFHCCQVQVWCSLPCLLLLFQYCTHAGVQSSSFTSNCTGALVIHVSSGQQEARSIALQHLRSNNKQSSWALAEHTQLTVPSQQVTQGYVVKAIKGS